MEKKYIIICIDEICKTGYNLTGQAHTKADALRIVKEEKKEYSDSIYTIKEI